MCPPPTHASGGKSAIACQCPSLAGVGDGTGLEIIISTTMLRLHTFFAISIIGLIISCSSPQSSPESSIRFEVSIPAEKHTEALDGRLFLLISTDDDNEPRFQIRDATNTQQVFGMDVESWNPGAVWTIDATAYGYPIEAMADLPAGEYSVQVLFHKYETFNLKTGHTVKLPMDRGEGQQWNRAPGNLYSKAGKIRIDPTSSDVVPIRLDQEIAPIEPAKDTKYIKHIQIDSKMLTEFWGRPMHLGAHVLLPEGFDEHPNARYPLAIMHGHFPHDFGGWRTEPPDPDLKPEYSSRFGIEGYNIIQQEAAYQFYKDWTGPNFPRCASRGDSACESLLR